MIETETSGLIHRCLISIEGHRLSNQWLTISKLASDHLTNTIFLDAVKLPARSWYKYMPLANPFAFQSTL